MTQQELKNFIINRKSELAKCQSFIDYLEFLKNEQSIDEMTYSKMSRTLNNRYYFLAKSINDHEKLLNTCTQ